MITRREPLLWLQLMAVAVIPLELELLRLLLAGPALGPAPALERLLIWGLAVIGPGLLLWRRRADWGSMLLVRLPLSGRSSDQRRISALPQALATKAALVLGMAVLLLAPMASPPKTSCSLLEWLQCCSCPCCLHCALRAAFMRVSTHA